MHTSRRTSLADEQKLALMEPFRVRDLLSSGDVAVGTYITVPAAAMVEIGAIGGLDFVRIDTYHAGIGRETLADMVRAAYAHRMTPWVRVRNDPREIAFALDIGAQAITVPNIESVDAARAAVSAARYPPRGTREMGRPLRHHALRGTDYVEWWNANSIVSCQIEGLRGIENCTELVRVEGVDVIQAGRGDISLALGLAGETMHPRVLEVEERIVSAALDAGKQVSLHIPATSEGIEYGSSWIQRGVRIFTVETDFRILMRQYRVAADDLRRRAAKGA